MTGQRDQRRADIAVIGLSGLFAGCKDKEALWETIVGKQDQVQDAPDSWATPWYEPAAEHDLGSARIGVRKVGLIGDLATFDPLAYGIPPNAVDGDPAHYLALRLAGDALADAGYDKRSFDRERTGIVVGHGASPNRGDATGYQLGFVIDQTVRILGQVMPKLTADDLNSARAALKRSLPEHGLEQIPSLVANVIAGRIANRLDLMGPNYMVDAACASSMIATDLGMRELRDGRCDMMLVGGVQASMPAQIYMMFSALGALSHGLLRPFDAAAGGTLLGEGVGFAVLKRLPDAIRDGDRIYAVLKGVGVASDGKAFGLLAPRLEGEILALRRAYAQAGLDPHSIGLIEAHGTGIPLGDRTEISALRHIFGPRRGKTPTCAIGSVKSMIGHCIPAAGIASLIKTSLSLHHRVLPPTLCDTVNPELGIQDTPFYVNTETRPWIHGADVPRRAGINAFGFGGINTHTILEEYREPIAVPPANIGQWVLRREASAEAPAAMAATPEPAWRRWPSELFVFAGDSREAVLASVHALASELAQDTDPAALAHRLYQSAKGDVRLAVVAADCMDLRHKLALVSRKLPHWKRPVMSSKQGIYYSEAPRGGKVAFMFSSEGSQHADMLRDLCLYFPKVRGWFDFLDNVFPRSPRPSTVIFPAPTCLGDETRRELDEQLYAGDLATESVSTASYALYEVVRDLGIDCDIMIGHSVGEHVALRASGIAQSGSMEQLKAVLRGLNKLYETMSAGDGVPTGTVISIGALARDKLDALLRELDGSLYLVSDNCPNQMILYADNAVSAAVIDRLQQAGAIYAVLPLTRAYHTPRFHQGVLALREFYATELKAGNAHTPVMSCSTVELYPNDPAEVLEIAARQWEKPVRFRDVIETLYRDGVRIFVELGPSSVLAAFVDNTLKGKDYLAVASNVQGRPALEQFQRMLAQLYVAKVPADLRPIWERGDPRPEDDAGGTGKKTPSSPQRLKSELPWLSLDAQVAGELGRKGAHADPPNASAEGAEATAARRTIEATAANRVPAADVAGTAAPPSGPVTETPPQPPGASERRTRAQSPSPIPTAGGAGGSRTSPEPDTQAREAILHRHFALMEDFLANQARVASLLSKTLNESDTLQK